MNKYFKTLISCLFCIWILSGCSLNHKVETSFDDEHSIEEMFLILQVALFKDRNKEAQAPHENKLQATLRTKNPSKDLDNFIRVIDIFLNEKNNSNKIKSYLAIIKDEEFVSLNVFNQAVVNFFLGKSLQEISPNQAFQFTQKAIIATEDNPEVYGGLLALLYYELGNVTRMEAMEGINSQQAYIKALSYCTSTEHALIASWINRTLASTSGYHKKRKEALNYYRKTEQWFKKSPFFQPNILWSKIYSGKLPVFKGLLKEPEILDIEKEAYVDSIKYYINLGYQQFSENKIDTSYYRNFQVFNINSVIEIGDYDKAKSWINELEHYYSLDTTNYCKNTALLNMSKYRLAWLLESKESYRDKVYNAYQHLENCADKKFYNYDLLKRNVLSYLIFCDTTYAKDYKKAYRWSKKQNTEISSYKEKVKLQAKELRFWAELEMQNAERETNLLIEKHKRIKTTILFITFAALVFLFLSGLLYRLNQKIQKQKAYIQSTNQKLQQTNSSLVLAKTQLEIDLKQKLLFMSNRNNIFLQLENKINVLEVDIKKKKELLRLTKPPQDQLWTRVQEEYFELNQEFVTTLSNKYPELTSNNIKLAIFLKMGLSLKEISQLELRSYESIKVAVSRLRKKLNLDTSIKSVTFLNSL